MLIHRVVNARVGLSENIVGVSLWVVNGLAIALRLHQYIHLFIICILLLLVIFKSLCDRFSFSIVNCDVLQAFFRKISSEQHLI